ncbi:class I SAM-dependent methyltransferase, partial [Zymomonas sp.]|uniref:class I SAM-dependent methyltransferase n=1 Tax=Zymomonas sp. TaxID=2068624 RepID=UPI0025DA9475
MEKVSFGFADVSPQEKTYLVGDVFRRVASRYDLMNDAMSGGLHRLWKDDFVRLVQPKPGEHILDMAGGTGDIAFRLAKSSAKVTISDINPAMLEVGKKRAVARSIENLIWKEENAENLS